MVARRVNVLVIVPTYNERENLPPLVRDILTHEGFQVMVVDDDSPDGTGAVADELARQFVGCVEVIHRTGLRGLGLSYVDGFASTLARTADVICQMDADLSHDPRHLPDMVAATDQHDLVIGSRYLDGAGIVNWPPHRLALSALANRYIRSVTGLSVRDCTSGFRCWRREGLAKLPLERLVSDGYAFLVETLYEAAAVGCRIGEVPIIFVERRHGRSKLSTRVLIESLIIPWRLAWRRRMAGSHRRRQH